MFEVSRSRIVGAAAHLRVEHDVNLLATKALGDENIDQPRQSDFATRAVDNCDDFRTWRAYAADEPRPFAAIHTSHRKMTPRSPKKA